MNHTSASTSTSYDDLLDLDLPEILLPGTSTRPIDVENPKESAISDYVTKQNSKNSETATSFSFEALESKFPDSLESLFHAPGAPLQTFTYSESSISALEVSEALKPPDSPIPAYRNPSTSKRTARPTECLVCGHPANGYHYDVASCNGCKTFFRRTCLSEKNFVCKADKDCFDLTKRETPLKCRACRHRKCISVGMNPLAMEIDEKEASSSNFKKLLKRTVIKEEEPDDDCQIVEVLNPRKAKNVIKVVETLENRLQKCIDGLVYLESKIEKFRKCSYNPNWVEIDGIEFLLQTESRIAYADRYEPMSGWPLPPHKMGPPKIGLPKKEPRPSPKHRPDRKQWFFFNLLTTVEYAKTFAFFNNLTSRDKLILTKYVTLACMNLHVSYSSVAQKFEEPIQPDGSPTPYFDSNHYDAMVMSVAPLIRCQIQQVEYLLLKAICLCNPAVPDLSPNAQSIISIAREKFADALFDHCLRNRPAGPAHFAQLIQIIDVLERQQRIQKDIHLLYVAPRLATLPKEYAIRVIEDVMDN